MSELSSISNQQLSDFVTENVPKVKINGTINEIDQYLSFNIIEQGYQEFKKNQSKTKNQIQASIKKTSMKKQLKKVKKIKKTKKFKKSKRINSKFHNFQKHLSTALRNMIKSQRYQNSIFQHEAIAALIWKCYESSTDESKTILHYIFNKEQTQVSEQLSQLKMLEIYECYGNIAFFQGIEQIRRWISVHMTEQIIEQYISSRRIHRKGNFKQYLLAFTTEVQQGSLRRRFQSRES